MINIRYLAFHLSQKLAASVRHDSLRQDGNQIKFTHRTSNSSLLKSDGTNNDSNIRPRILQYLGIDFHFLFRSFILVCT